MIFVHFVVILTIFHSAVLLKEKQHKSIAAGLREKGRFPSRHSIENWEDLDRYIQMLRLTNVKRRTKTKHIAPSDLTSSESPSKKVTKLNSSKTKGISKHRLNRKNRSRRPTNKSNRDKISRNTLHLPSKKKHKLKYLSILKDNMHGLTSLEQDPAIANLLKSKSIRKYFDKEKRRQKWTGKNTGTYPWNESSENTSKRAPRYKKKRYKKRERLSDKLVYENSNRFPIRLENLLKQMDHATKIRELKRFRKRKKNHSFSPLQNTYKDDGQSHGSALRNHGLPANYNFYYYGNTPSKTELDNETCCACNADDQEEKQGNGKPFINPHYNISQFGAFRLNTHEMTWNEARETCTAEKAHLAVINSNAEAQYLIKLMHEKIVTHVWLGIHDLFEDRIWVSILDEPLGYTGWDEWSNVNGIPQPANDNGNEHCVSYDAVGMDDRQCNETKAFICEIAIAENHQKYSIT